MKIGIISDVQTEFLWKKVSPFGFSCGLPALIEVMANQHLVEVLCCWFDQTAKDSSGRNCQIAIWKPFICRQHVFLSTSRRDLTFPKKSLDIEMVPVPVELFF